MHLSGRPRPFSARPGRLLFHEMEARQELWTHLARSPFESGQKLVVGFVRVGQRGPKSSAFDEGQGRREASLREEYVSDPCAELLSRPAVSLSRVCRTLISGGRLYKEVHMQKKATPKKLILSKETLRMLADDKLWEVVGGHSAHEATKCSICPGCTI